MALAYVTLSLDLYDGAGNYPSAGTATFTPSAVLTSPGNGMTGQIPVVASFRGAPVTVTLLATDNEGITPADWTWGVTFSGVAGAPGAFSFPLAYADGASQDLSSLYP
jgi:hypothetical protein